MPRQDEPTTIAEILMMEPSRSKEDKSWIGGTFEAVVRRAEKIAPRGKTYHFFTAYLHDPHQDHLKIKCTSDIDFTRFEGELVEIGGTGISREEYKGIPEIKMGRNATAHVCGSAPRPEPEDRAAESSATTAARPESKGERHPYGPAIGGAIQNAVNCILQSGMAMPGTPEFSTLLFQIASDILRVNEYMESGKLAPGPKKRAAGGQQIDDPEDAEAKQREAEEKAKAAAAAKAKAAAEKAAREAEEANLNEEEEDDDDVPF